MPKKSTIFPISLIAPCGMNCSICRAFLREKNKCPGCRGTGVDKMISCLRCRIKNCKTLKNGKLKYCFECDIFPCARVKRLDKRYRTKYKMSMIENLGHIKKLGIRKFVKKEAVRWSCKRCGGVICVHGGQCVVCEEIL